MPRRWTPIEEKEKRKELVVLYCKKNLPIGEIATLLQLNQSTIYDRLLRLNIPIDRSSKPHCDNRRTDIVFPNHSEELAECVGILLGDGHISATQVMVTLGNKEEQYVEEVVRIMQNLFGVTPGVTKKAKGYATVYIGSTALVRYFLDMGLNGNKLKAQVTLPSWITNDRRYTLAALRGLFDTDGCVYKLKFGIQISFVNHSQPLLRDVHSCLVQHGFHPSKASQRAVYLTRREDLAMFQKLIGFRNSKHHERFGSFLSSRKVV